MSNIHRIKGLEIDLDFMEVVCSTPENEMLQIIQTAYPHAKVYPTPNDELLIYVDNNSPVLGVAHMDGTMPATHFFSGFNYKTEDLWVFSPFVDDRIGVFTMLYFLPQVDIVPDLLFTVGEEWGQSTAQFFEPKKDKKYNWIFEFDRKGTDIVTYMYKRPEWLAALSKYFPEINHGSASDISKMCHLGSQAVNIGSGYHDYTTQWNARCHMNELTEQFRRFEGFYREFKDTEFHHSVSKRKSFTRGHRYSRGGAFMDGLPWSASLPFIDMDDDPVIDEDRTVHLLKVTVGNGKSERKIKVIKGKKPPEAEEPKLLTTGNAS